MSRFSITSSSRFNKQQKKLSRHRASSFSVTSSSRLNKRQNQNLRYSTRYPLIVSHSSLRLQKRPSNTFDYQASSSSVTPSARLCKGRNYKCLSPGILYCHIYLAYITTDCAIPYWGCAFLLVLLLKNILSTEHIGQLSGVTGHPLRSTAGPRTRQSSSERRIPHEPTLQSIKHAA